MAATLLPNLVSYGSDSDSDNSSDNDGSGDTGPAPVIDATRKHEYTAHLKPVRKLRPLPGAEEVAPTTALAVVAAPEVELAAAVTDLVPIDPGTKEVMYNPKYEQLFTPEVGPDNPLKTQQAKAEKNTHAGFVEPAHFNDFHFENQWRTFHSYGKAIDPTVGENKTINKVVTDLQLNAKTTNPDEPTDKSIYKKIESAANAAATVEEFGTVFEKLPLRPGDKRKKERNEDPLDIEGWKGPWAKYKDEVLVSKPTEEEKKVLDEYLAKKAGKRGKFTEAVSAEEKVTLHIKDPHDYQGRSFLHAPQDVGVNLRSEEPPTKCFLPKKLIHTWEGHTKGISCIRWFPKTAHLLLSSSMDSKIKLWEVYNRRRLIQTYSGHKQAVRDVCFNNDGTQFLSASYDRFCKLWDTETGECISRFSSRKVPYCVKFNPDDDKQHLFVCGTSDKKILCWDTRSGDIVQEYDRHLGAVNTITFIDNNRRFVSTSDDKSVRVWEWDIPVDFKYLADPSMHSMPYTVISPNQKWLACQSMDNQIMIFNALNRFKWHRKKTFKGHMVAGYACGIDFSPDMTYLISGDADGKLFIWDWKTSRLYSKFKAHDQVCIQAIWHPHETSKIATAGWDGVIKFWD